jgi:hypothetical protein
MELLFLTCAESASIDQTTNRLSLFNIVEEISAAAFPGMVPSAALVMIAERESHEPDQATLQLSLLLNGQQLYSASLVVHFQQQMRCRVVANMNGIPLNGPGRLEFNVEYSSKSLGRWPVEIKALPSPVIAPPPQPVPTANAISAVAPTTVKRRQISKKATKKKKS